MIAQIDRLSRIVLNSADPPSLARFYIDVIGFSRVSDASEGQSIALSLGPSRLDLVRATGRPYPPDVPGWNLLFQHFAIVTRDMTHAMERLKATGGWTAISTDGPQMLPERSGGVTAFKFRDPDGHPLEFLFFPSPHMPPFWRERASKDACLGIDHSAISVVDTAGSIAFYESLGFRADGGSHNFGVEQARLDGIPDADVDVTALRVPARTPPHLELLAYRGTFPSAGERMGEDDIAATRLVLTVRDASGLEPLIAAHRDRVVRRTGGSALLLRDPDGHFLQLEAAPSP